MVASCFESSRRSNCREFDSLTFRFRRGLISAKWESTRIAGASGSIPQRRNYERGTRWLGSGLQPRVSRFDSDHALFRIVSSIV